MDAWDPTAAYLAGEYRPIGNFCPRCGRHDRAIGFGAQMSCGHCGMEWQASVTELPPARPREPEADPGAEVTRLRRRVRRWRGDPFGPGVVDGLSEGATSLKPDAGGSAPHGVDTPTLPGLTQPLD